MEALHKLRGAIPLCAHVQLDIGPSAVRGRAWQYRCLNMTHAPGAGDGDNAGAEASPAQQADAASIRCASNSSRCHERARNRHVNRISWKDIQG